MTTLLQCPNCFAPLPPPGSGHTTCRFCGATSLTQGASAAASEEPPKAPSPKAPTKEALDPLGAKALAIDVKRQLGIDITKDATAMQRLGEAWTKAEKELTSATRTEINLPYIGVTKNGPVHYECEMDRKRMVLFLEAARKL